MWKFRKTEKRERPQFSFDNAHIEVQLPLFCPIIFRIWHRFSVLDLVWPWSHIPSSKNWKIQNRLNIGILHIKWKLETSALHFQCNTAVFNWYATCLHKIIKIIILTILEVERSKEVKSWSWRVFGQKRKVVTYFIVGCSGFFWYTSYAKFWGHQRSMKVSLRSVIWPQTCSDIFSYADVFRFHLICNMPILNWFWIYQFEVGK